MVLLRGKEEMESGSGSEHMEGMSGNEQDSVLQPKKKRYHRHTARQIQEMEAYVLSFRLYQAHIYKNLCMNSLKIYEPCDRMPNNRQGFITL